MVITKAGEALRWAVDPSNPKRISQTELASRLKVSQPSVSEWVRMNTRPESHLRKALEHILSIPENAWMTEAEQAVIERAEKDASESRDRAAAESAPATAEDIADSVPVASAPAA